MTQSLKREIGKEELREHLIEYYEQTIIELQKKIKELKNE